MYFPPFPINEFPFVPQEKCFQNSAPCPAQCQLIPVQIPEHASVRKGSQ